METTSLMDSLGLLQLFQTCLWTRAISQILFIIPWTSQAHVILVIINNCEMGENCPSHIKQITHLWDALKVEISREVGFCLPETGSVFL